MDQNFLFVSQEQHQTVNLKEGWFCLPRTPSLVGVFFITGFVFVLSDFVCVLDLGVFDLVLKLCQRNEEFGDLPQVERQDSPPPNYQ